MKKTFFRFLMWILLVFLSACSTTTLTGVWKDPGYSGKLLHKVLVVGISDRDLYRRLLEDEFSRQLKTHGIVAVSSYMLFSDEELKDKNTVASKIRGMGFDAMLISRITGQRTDVVRQPGRIYVQHEDYRPRTYHRGWHEYYTKNYNIIHEPAYTIKYQVITMESNLYDTATDKLVWGVISDTVVEENLESQLKSYIQVVMDNLVKAKLF